MKLLIALGIAIELGAGSLGAAAAEAASSVSYDIATGKIVPFTAQQLGEASAPTVGSGQPIDHPQLTQGDIQRLASVEAFFAPYEIRDGRKDTQGNFVPFSVILPDERVRVSDTTNFPARAVISIDFAHAVDGKRYGCSGAMVAPNLALTAGHCVFEGGWHRDFIVMPGRNGPARPFGECRAVKLFALAEWVNPPATTDSRLYDLGAIQLNCDVGKNTGVFGLRILAQDEAPVLQINGYPCDLPPAGGQWLSRGALGPRVALKIFYKNDTFGCMSGSPVFVEGDARIFAVHTNGLHNGEPWGSNNAGTLINAERKALIDTWTRE